MEKIYIPTPEEFQQAIAEIHEARRNAEKLKAEKFEPAKTHGANIPVYSTCGTLRAALGGGKYCKRDAEYLFDVA